MRQHELRWIPLVLLGLLSACSTSRVVTVNSSPANAQLAVDGIPRGPAPLTEKFKFSGAQPIHRVTATRSGYQDQTITLTRDDPSTIVEIELKPFTRRLTFIVSPVAAIVSINGVPASPDRVQKIIKELEFTKDDRGNWTKYTITAARPGFQTAQQIVTWADPSVVTDVVLRLQPMRKDVSIATTPPGATVSIDGETIGQSPVVKGRDFIFDVDSAQFVPQKVRLTKAGYDPHEETITWEGGKADYHFDLPAKRKSVHILTDPAGATVAIDGKPALPGPDGVPAAELVFTPKNDRGDLPVFVATVSKRTAETEWYPTTMPIAWDNGKPDYSAQLKEVKSRLVPLTSITLDRNADGVWEVSPRIMESLAIKDVGEGPGKEPPALVYAAPLGTSLGTLTVSPTGSKILFTVITGKNKIDLRSQIFAINSDGTGGVEQITDGKALDLMPSFTPAGDQIVFASNRAGKRLNIWRKSIAGFAGIEQLTNTQEQDLWPMVDAGPKPRLFYEALSDSQADAQLYVAPAEGGSRMNLTTISVNQPRISPKADSILFTSANARTGNREIYRIPDRGGPPVNLTNDPDSDCYDPVWSKDGSQIAYVSDRGIAEISDRGLEEDRRRNADIWVIDLSRSDRPIQVTSNGSVDDCPAWDPNANALYFRSNRGGQWGIWRITVK